MARTFVDLHIHSDYSNGVDNLSEIINYAEKLDLSSLAVVEEIESVSELSRIKEIRERINHLRTNIRIYIGIELKTDNPDNMKTLIAKSRPLVDLLMVYGGNVDINRIAVEDSRVDILSRPEFSRKDSGLDEAMVKLAAKNHVAIEFNFRSVLHTYSKVRSHILFHMRHNWSLVSRFEAPFLITSGAKSIWDMRTGRELASFGTVIGMELATALDAVSLNCEKIMDLSSKRK